MHPIDFHVKSIRRLFSFVRMRISALCPKGKYKLLATKNTIRHLVIFSDCEARTCFSIGSHVKIIKRRSMGSRTLIFDYSS